ncbi:hypothetical protein GYB22_00675 [bacterium]|nr:hypothetical protein [bacterium]
MRIGSLIFFILAGFSAIASDARDFFYSSGKIYVVVSVLLIIFLGIVLYLIRLERKIKKLEDKDEA